MGFVWSRFGSRAKAPEETLPAYSEYTPAIENTSHRIRETDPPQWLWKNSQCKEWIQAVLCVYFEVQIKDAELLANKFKGFGPNLWVMQRNEWMELMGPAVGSGIFSLLMTMYKEKGTIPPKITVLQYEPKPRQ